MLRKINGELVFVNDAVKASNYVDGLGSLGFQKDYTLPGNMESINADSSIASNMPEIGGKAVDEMMALSNNNAMDNLMSMPKVNDMSSDGGLGASLQGGFDWLGKNKEAINTGLGVLNAGLGLYSTFAGQGKKLYDKNMQLLNQRIADNADKLARRKALNEAYAKHL